MKVVRVMAMAFATFASLLACSATRASSVPTRGSGAASSSLRDAATAWAGAAVARDAAGMARYFARDVYAMYPTAQPTVGADANRAGWTRTFSRPGLNHPITTDSVVVSASGELGYSVGRWHLSAPAADDTRPKTESGGRYLAIWRRIDGAWLIVALSANALQPAPAME